MQQRQTAYMMQVQKKLAHHTVHKHKPILVGEVGCCFGAALPFGMAST